MLLQIKAYEIKEEIGRGGMATVYKAWQPSLSRLVALKVLPPYFAHDDELLTRFRHEARAVAKLRHPHIVQVYDFDQEGDIFYLAMEYIGGGSLQAALAAAGRLSPPAAAKLVLQVAAGLHHAHEKGFVHRDIKPSNILLTEEGDAVITDFGIVKALEGTGLTRTVASGLGTSEYMSPEQAKGEQVDCRSDLYSLGVVLYEALTGNPPFFGDSPVAVVHSQIYEEPARPSKINPAIDLGFEEIVLKLIAKQPDDRYASALELAAALHSIDIRDPAAALEAEDNAADEASGRSSRPTLLRRETRLSNRWPALKKRPDVRLGSAVNKKDHGSPGPAREPEASPRRRLRRAVAGLVIVLASGLLGYTSGKAYLYPPLPERAAARSKSRPAPAAKIIKPATKEATAGAQEPQLERLAIEPAEASLTVGDSLHLSARIGLSEGSTTDLPVSWTVSDASLVSITDGELTGLAPGRVEVTAEVRAGDRSTTATASFVVAEKPEVSPPPQASTEPARVRPRKYSPAPPQPTDAPPPSPAPPAGAGDDIPLTLQ